MQRMLATACAAVLALLMPAIELEDATPVDAKPTNARHTGSALHQKSREARLYLASWTAGDTTQPRRPDLRAFGDRPDRADTGDERRAVEAAIPAASVEPVPLPNLSAPGFTDDDLPSLAALDAAFDAPIFPALAALDAAFDNRAIKLPPVPLPWRRPPTVAEMCDTLAVAATAHNLPAPFLIRLIWQESRFHHNVVSHAGAQGIAQFMPGTATYMGLDDPFNPLEALPQSARLLRKLIERFGNLGLAAAAYNAGPRRVLDWLAKKGELPQETQNYVKIVTGRPAEDWRKREAVASLPRVPERAPCQREAGLRAADGPDRVPLPPDRTPEKVLVAKATIKANDKAKDKKTPDGKSTGKAGAVQLAAMRNVKSKTKSGETPDKPAARSANAAPSGNAKAEPKEPAKGPKKIAAAAKR